MVGFKIFFLLLCFFSVFAEIPPPTDSEFFENAKKILNGKSHYVQQRVNRLGHKTLSIETYMSANADLECAKKIFADYSHYGDWALNGINQRPSGGFYYMQLLGFMWSPKEPNILTAKIAFTFPLLNSEIERKMRFSQVETKNCLTVQTESLPHDTSLVEVAKGVLKLCQNPSQPEELWGYLQGKAIFRSWFVYEAIPDHALKKETGDRIIKFIENYQGEENRRENKKGAHPSPKAAATGSQ